MVGFSNGGMLTHRFAAEQGTLLAAVAPVSSSIGGTPSKKVPVWRIPDPVSPVPVIILHGLADDHVPVSGGRSNRGSREYISVEDTVSFWVTHNGCASRFVVNESYGGAVHEKAWLDCEDNLSVRLCLIDHWGHVWPGKYFTGALEDTSPIKDFDAAEILWQFLKIHRRRP